MAGAVHHREAGVHEHLPQQLDAALVLAAQRAALGALQDPHGLQGPGQQHGRQRRGEDEAGCVRAHRVHQGAGAGDVASDAAEGFAWGETAFTAAAAPGCTARRGVRRGRAPAPPGRAAASEARMPRKRGHTEEAC